MRVECKVYADDGVAGICWNKFGITMKLEIDIGDHYMLIVNDVDVVKVFAARIGNTLEVIASKKVRTEAVIDKFFMDAQKVMDFLEKSTPSHLFFRVLNEVLNS